MRSPTAGARSHLAHIKCSRATYHAQSHRRCAIATGSHQVQTCQVACAVSWPVRDRHWLTASAYVPRTMRSLTHFKCAIATGSRRVQTSHVPCAVLLPVRDRNWRFSSAYHTKCRRATYRAQSRCHCAIATVTGSRHVLSHGVEHASRFLQHGDDADLCGGTDVPGVWPESRRLEVLSLRPRCPWARRARVDGVVPVWRSRCRPVAPASGLVQSPWRPRRSGSWRRGRRLLVSLRASPGSAPAGRGWTRPGVQVSAMSPTAGRSKSSTHRGCARMAASRLHAALAT